MLILPSLHTYLSQLLAPPSVHTALLFTPEGALVSYASRTSPEGTLETLAHAPQPSAGSPTAWTPSSPGSAKSSGSLSSTPQGSKPGSTVGEESCAPPRTKDEIRMAAGLGAEVWAETRGEGEGMVESELGRILVVAVEDDAAGEDAEPLLLLAVNGTLEAEWDVMRVKARKLATFLAPSVNKHRGSMGATATTARSLNGSKSRTRSTATSPGRGLK